MFTVAEIIEIAEISQFLAANDIAKNGLNVGGGAYLNLPRQLYMERRTVQRMYELDPSDDTLTKTSNWLLALCGKYRFKAQSIMGGGGSVAPVTPGSNVPHDLDFIVSATSFIPTGGVSAYIPQFIGYDVDLAIGGTVQYTTPQPDGARYYSWNSVTGYLTLLSTDPDNFPPNATEGEAFRIMVDAGGGGSVTPTQTYPFVITSADFEPGGVIYNNESIIGDQLMIFISGYNSEWQFAPTAFVYTVTGIAFVIPGFDAANYGNIIIQKIN